MNDGLYTKGCHWRHSKSVIGATVEIPHTIAAQPGRCPRSGDSPVDKSLATIGSWISHIEEKLDSMENSISAYIVKGMEDLVKSIFISSKVLLSPLYLIVDIQADLLSEFVTLTHSSAFIRRLRKSLYFFIAIVEIVF